MKSVYHIVTIRVNETSWAHVWRLHSHYLGTGYDIRRGGRASMRSRGAERNEGNNGRNWCGGVAEGIFVCTSVVRR
jgi:hypothetical protein